jgi:undecaprenyl-diphosphatase
MDNLIVLALHQLATSSPILSTVTVAIAEGGIFLLPLILWLVWVLPGDDRTRSRTAVIAGAISIGCALLLSILLGVVIDRPRPFVALAFTPLFPHGADSSFPSDHTLLGEALVGPLVVLRRRVGIPAALCGLVVGFGRVAAGVHFPSDIVLSAALAAVPTSVGLGIASFARGRVPIGKW